MFWLGLGIGTFVGGLGGIFILAMFITAGRNDGRD